MSQPTTNESGRSPWYRRSLLPDFLPPWLVLSLVLGGTFAFIAGDVPSDAATPTVATAIGFGIGFCAGVYFPVCVHLFQKEIDPASGMLPPAWIAAPITVAAFAGLGVLVVHERELSLGRGSAVVRGPFAVAAGFLVIAAAGFGSGLLMRSKPRRLDRVVAGWIGVGVAVAGLVFAAASLFRHRGG